MMIANKREQVGFRAVRSRQGLWICGLTCMVILGLAGMTGCTDQRSAGRLEEGFVNPPPHARPWVYWFWLNGNLTRQGITADLEAMARAGIGGVLIMEVDQGAPAGGVAFAGPKWRELFEHVCREADRLGLKVNMNNDAGWCGSGGPWVKPEHGMQKLVWTQVQVTGPRRIEQVLPRPEAVDGFYRDVAILAYPTPAEPASLPLGPGKAYVKAVRVLNPPAHWPDAPAGSIVRRDQVRMLTGQLGAGDRLTWDVPAGRWTILRLGHTLTGSRNHPAPASGTGLECDKLSKQAVQAHFDALIGSLAHQMGPLVGRTLVSTHIDSWEVGIQNWTADFPQAFRARRGYDPLPWMPAVTGCIVGSREMTERFLWDLRQTVSQLLLDNYAGYMRQLANRHGLRLSIEGYRTCLTNELAYAGRADEPMGEFWSWPRFGYTFGCTQAASAAHVYGRRIVGAEAFTANRRERWLGHPGNIKDLGDWALCEGINRLVFHRYAMQPWPDRRPGMSMGPWGLHYERTQTWWEQSAAWHRYLARCQYLLRQGLFVADMCLMTPEGSPQSIAGLPTWTGPAGQATSLGRDGSVIERPGHNFDLCPPEVVLNRMSVRDGRLVLPDGMSYRVLVLPNTQTMTPTLLARIKQLLEEGATVIGAPPLKSPSLSGYPRCDAQVQRLAGAIWGQTEIPSTITERRVGKGRVFWGGALTAGRRQPQQIPSLDQATWIWHDQGDPIRAVPPGMRYFRRVLTLPADRGKVVGARLVMTADNAFTCWVNGRQAGAGNDFKRAWVMEVGGLLHPGRNVIAVAARNDGTSPNPAGLIAVLSVKFESGREIRLQTDRSWTSAETVGPDWRGPEATGSSWKTVRELGRHGMSPWGAVEQPGSRERLYTDLAVLDQFLTSLVPADFQVRLAGGEQALRYIHRTTDQAEIYFVANKTTEPQTGVCLFRVYGRRPEFWWPRTGRIERPAVYDVWDGRLAVPLSLEPLESVFVIFRKGHGLEPDRVVEVQRDGRTLLKAAWPTGAKPALHPEAGDVVLRRGADGRIKAVVRRPGRYVLRQADGRLRELHVGPMPAPVALDGPWQVRFDPKWGGPQQATFEQLIPWNRHADKGIRYYSGSAVYCRRFTVPGSMLTGGRRLVLDLGRVEVMAEVSVNGKVQGTLWKAPYRLDITEAVHAGENEVAITVVNLWINRMIGDEHLPEDSPRRPNGTLEQWPEWLEQDRPSPTGRYTFTSWRLWSKDEPLVDSGLLGPVRLQSWADVTLDR